MIRSDLEIILDTYPDKMADALKEWRIATWEKQKYFATESLKVSANSPEMKTPEIKNTVLASTEYGILTIQEIEKESAYKALEQTLMSKKIEYARA